MNRIHLRLLLTCVIGMLLVLASSSAASAQVSYTITGTLELQSGIDSLGLSGHTVKAKTTINQNATATNSASSGSSSSNSYSGETVTLASFDCSATPAAVVTLTDNVGAPDIIAIDNCDLSGLATVSASVTIPSGAMITAVPAAIPTTNITGTITAVLPGPPPTTTVFSLTNGTIVATGTAPPAVIPSPASWLTPAAVAGSTTPQTQTVNLSTGVTNAVDSITTSSSGGSWLSVSPASTNSTQQLTITVNPTGLTAAVYNGTVSLNYGTSGLAATTIPVTFTVVPPPSLTGPSTPLTFGYTTGGTQPSAQTVNIGITSGSATVSAAVTSGNSWLSVSPPSATASSTTPASFQVSVNTSGLTANTYNGQIQFTAPGVAGSPLTVNVSLTVSSNTLTVSTTPLTFNYTIGGSQPAAQNVSIGGTSGISFSTSTAVTTPAGGTWLLATPGSGTVSGSSAVSVSIATTGLAPGTYTGTVTVTSTGAAGSPANIPVTLNVTGPVLTTNPSASSAGLSFNYQIGSSAPASQPIAVSSTPGSISFTAAPATSTGGSWLKVSPAGGTTPSSGTTPVNVSVDTSVLTTAGAGTYNGTVTIAATGATSQVINVSVTVTQPTITPSTTSLSFSYQLGTSAPAAQNVNITGTSGLQVTATASGGSWLSVSPGTLTISSSSKIAVSINTSGLTVASSPYTGSISLTAAGAVTQTINVTLTVSSTPTISASPASLTFAYQTGTAAPPTQPVAIGGTTGLAFTAAASPSGSWLTVSPASGTTSATSSISVGLNTAALTTAGTFTGTVTISSPGITPATVNVTVVVSNLPAITASPSSLTFAYTVGGTAPVAQAVQITGGSALAFTVATVGAPWLAVSPISAKTPGSVSVSVNTASLTTAGTYHGSITVTSSGASNSPLTIPVTINVNVEPISVVLTPSALSFTATAGASAATPPQTVSLISNVAASPVAIALEGGTWLTATLSSPTAPATITVSVNQFNLPAGNYVGVIVVFPGGLSSTNTPVNIPVSFKITAPLNISASPANLSFAFMPASSSSAAQAVSVTSQTVSITAPQPVPVSVSVVGGTWLTAITTASTTPASVTVSVDPSSLPQGTYQATVTITSAAISNSPLVIPVTLIVADDPMLAPSPMNLTFVGQAGGSNPPSQTLNISASAALPFSVSTAASWLSVSAPSGTAPSNLVVGANTAGLAPGSYQGAITILAPAAGNTPITIPITLNISMPLVVTGGPSIASVVNAASYEIAGFSPGSIVSIFGNLLGPETGVSFSLNSNGSIDPSLAGVSVTVDGAPAIPLFVQNGQINVILPYGIGTKGEANVQVAYHSLTSAQFNIPLMPSDVQLFTVNNIGTGPGSILNQDYSLNSKTNPAAPGSVVSVYGTGAGEVNPPVPAGGIAGDKLSMVALPFSATINGESAIVLYAGTAPGLVYGVYQFNIQLPTDLPAGELPLVMQVGDSASQANVTLFVK